MVPPQQKSLMSMSDSALLNNDSYQTGRKFRHKKNYVIEAIVLPVYNVNADITYRSFL